MEQLLHYVWKHKLFPLSPLTTTWHQAVEVIDPGLHNRNAGPDFFNAKIKLNGTLWVGNVEIHDKASDWYVHGHDKDERYDNVILHVCGTIDVEAKNSKGEPLVQLQLDIPENVSKHYQELLSIDQYPPCYQIIPSLTRLTVHSWMSALQTERLSQKTDAIEARVKQCNGDWENAYFVTLARNYGFGINGDAFEQWAYHLPLRAVDHHRDDLFQIEAIFLGQAGLLELNTIPERYQKDALNDGYFSRLRNEYLYLSHKFSLQPMDYKQWRFLRLRPQNFPHIRISQLANLYYNRRAGLSQLLEASTVKEAKQVLSTSVTEYWETHYTFGSTSIRNEKHLSPFSLNLLIINTVVPILFAYGRHRGEEKYCDRAFDFLEELKAENNHIVRMWKECGLPVENAGDSQALIQLKKEYCDRKECLRCRIGYEYLKKIKIMADQQEILNTILLTRLNYFSLAGMLELYRKVGSATLILEHKNNLRDILPDASDKLVSAIQNCEEARKRAEEELEYDIRYGIEPIPMNDDRYPQRLKDCDDAPLILFYKGNANLNQQRVINIVGTRHCTPYGEDLIRRFITDLKQLSPNVLIISGLAYGVDIVAHRQALANGYETIGVLAHGLDDLYPRQHRETAARMIEQGGLLTEFLTRTNADKINFVRRNRIVAGMSDACILIESAAHGGGLITCDISQSYGRDVFAFPGRIGDHYSEGCNNLIRNNGATLITSAEDFVKDMRWQDDATLMRAKQQGIERSLFPELSPEEQLIVEVLSKTNDLQVNLISVKTNIDISRLTSLLFTLEMKGVIKTFAGGMYHLLK